MCCCRVSVLEVNSWLVNEVSGRYLASSLLSDGMHHSVHDQALVMYFVCVTQKGAFGVTVSSCGFNRATTFDCNRWLTMIVKHNESMAPNLNAIGKASIVNEINIQL